MLGPTLGARFIEMPVRGDLTVIYNIGLLDSGALEREARQRRTMGKKIDLATKDRP